MKRLIPLVPLMAMSIALVLLRVADSAASIGDTSILGSEAASRVDEVGNPDTANTTVTIIMRTPPLPQEWLS